LHTMIVVPKFVFPWFPKFSSYPPPVIESLECWNDPLKEGPNSSKGKGHAPIEKLPIDLRNL